MTESFLTNARAGYTFIAPLNTQANSKLLMKIPFPQAMHQDLVGSSEKLYIWVPKFHGTYLHQASFLRRVQKLYVNGLCIGMGVVSNSTQVAFVWNLLQESSLGDSEAAITCPNARTTNFSASVIFLINDNHSLSLLLSLRLSPIYTMWWLLIGSLLGHQLASHDWVGSLYVIGSS